MNRAEVLALARTKTKHSWQVYSLMKNLLDEICSNADYEQFIKELAEVLEI